MGFIARIAARFAGRRAAPRATIEERRRQLGDALARGDTDTALEHCAAILARDPDDASALYSAGVLRLKRDETEQALAHFVRLEESTSGGARTARLVHDAVMDSERAARREPYVATFSDALVETSYWAVVVGDRLFRRELHGRGIARSPFVRGRMSPDRTRCIVSVPRVPPRITTPCVLLGSDDNYAHWVLRNVLKLALLEGMPLADETRFLVREDLRGWQSEYLELLGIPKERLLPVPNEALIACDRLIVPTMLSFHPRMSQGIAWLRRKIAPLLAPQENANARIYASRREQGKRRVLNEPDLESALERIGFEVIVPGEMSVREQIAAFSRARIVVSPHGAALANMVFAPPGAVMVELVSTAIQHMSEMRFLCAAAGLHSEWVISGALAESAQVPDTPAMHRDFRVDVDEVLAAVRRRLAAQEEGFEREARDPLRPPGR